MTTIKKNGRTWFSIDRDVMGHNDAFGGDNPTSDQESQGDRFVKIANEELERVRVQKHLNNFQIPEYYHRYAKKFAKEVYDGSHGGAKLNSTMSTPAGKKNVETTIMEESYVMDKVVGKVYYEDNIWGQIFSEITRPLGRFKWTVKQYVLKKIEHAVKYTTSFDEPNVIQLKTDNQIDSGIGWFVGYSVGHFDLLENRGELIDLLYETRMEAAIQMARTANEHLPLGTTSQLGMKLDTGASDTTLTGFANNASNQSFTISTPSTWGNWVKGIRNGLGDLKTCRASRNIKMIMTAGCLPAMQNNYPTYGRGDYNEWNEVQKEFFRSGLIKQCWTSDKWIGATAPTQTTAKVMLSVVDPKVMTRFVVLPLQTLADLTKHWENDVNEVVLAADIMRFDKRADTDINAFPVTASGDLDVGSSAGTGYVEERRLA